MHVGVVDETDEHACFARHPRVDGVLGENAAEDAVAGVGGHAADDVARVDVLEIDLDLLFYGQDVVNENGLIIPHPEIHKRRFVLEPLCETASYFIHPSFGVSIRGLKERLSDKKVVEKITE